MEYQAQQGPMDGEMLPRREHSGVKGILLVDKPDQWCWLYDWNEDLAKYVCRNPIGMSLDDERRWTAAESGDYDVVAAPWVV